jgi:hypothetical protein
VVAIIAGDALRRGGLQAVLTGGACAAVHSKGRYTSRDVDFVLPLSTKKSVVEQALTPLGYRWSTDCFVHKDSRFFIEFPVGPLSIGEDLSIRPELIGINATETWALTATDSCRDRLAAYYHWRDRQALEVAVWIARESIVDLETIRDWSVREGRSQDFEHFLRRLESGEGP